MPDSLHSSSHRSGDRQQLTLPTLSCCWLQTIRMWDIRRSGCLAIFDQHNTRPSAATAASTSSSLSSRYSSPSPALSSSHSMRDVTSHSASVSHLAFVPSSSLLLSLGADSRLRLWSPFTTVNTLTHYSRISSSYRYARFSVSSHDRVWLGSGKEVLELGVHEGGAGRRHVGHFDRVNVCAVNERWDEVYSAGVDHGLLVWDRKDDRTRWEKEEGEEDERKEDEEGAAEHDSVLAVDRDEWSDDER